MRPCDGEGRIVPARASCEFRHIICIHGVLYGAVIGERQKAMRAKRRNDHCVIALCVELDLQRIERRIQTGYLDERAADLDDALTRLDTARRERRPLSIGPS